MDRKVKFLTSDNISFTVDKDIAILSKLVKGILQDLNESNDEIPLPNVNSKIMQIILKWGEIHRNDPDPSTFDDKVLQPDVGLDIEERDMEIVNVSKKVLFDVILAANYLDIEGLMTLGCKALALDLKDKSIDQVGIIVLFRWVVFNPLGNFGYSNHLGNLK
jgi:S-phase kinase-associated protein 1